MKIAHLSDLHICAKNRPENIERTETLLETALENGMDHLVITGDISHNSQPLDFHILRDLLKKYDLLHPDKLSVVIGNHDIYGGVHLATDVLNFPKKCINLDYHQRINEFGRYFEETFIGTQRPEKTEYFPYAKDLGDIVLFGINSNARYSHLTNPLASNGKIYPDQYNRLRDLLANQRFNHKQKVVLMHHHALYNKDNGYEFASPMWQLVEKHTMKILGKRKLMKLFSRYNVGFVFHGHIHVNNDYTYRSTRYFNAGGSLEYDVFKQTMLNMVTLTDQNVHFEIISTGKKQFNVENLEFVDQLIPSFAG